MYNSLIPFRKDMLKFDDFFGKTLDDLSPFSSSIRVDIVEKDDAYIVEAEMPGLTKEQIKLNYHNSYLLIGFEIKDEVSEEKEHYIRRERNFKKSSRSFFIENIDEKNIKAKYEHGILSITLPKFKITPKPQDIKID